MDKKRILIFGSCVSRDAFELVSGAAEDFVIVDYFARSSFASLSFCSCVDEAVLDLIASPFQRKMVRHDMSKYFLDRILNSDYDFILIDLIDDRFNIFRDGAQGVTYSNEYRSAGRKSSNFSMIKSGSSEYEDFWVTGFNKFYAILNDAGYSDRIILNELFYAKNANRCDSGYEKFEQQISMQNKYLQKRYDYLQEYVKKDHWIIYDDSDLVADSEHKWGVAPFHYVGKLYSRTIESLRVLSQVAG